MKMIKVWGLKVPRTVFMGSASYQRIHLPDDPLLNRLDWRVPESFEKCIEIRRQLEREEGQYRGFYFWVQAHLANLSDRELMNFRKMWLEGGGVKPIAGAAIERKGKQWKKYDRLQQKVQAAWWKNERQYWKVKWQYMEAIRVYLYIGGQMAAIERLKNTAA